MIGRNEELGILSSSTSAVFSSCSKAAPQTTEQAMNVNKSTTIVVSELYSYTLYPTTRT